MQGHGGDSRASRKSLKILRLGGVGVQAFADLYPLSLLMLGYNISGMRRLLRPYRRPYRFGYSLFFLFYHIILIYRFIWLIYRFIWKFRRSPLVTDQAFKILVIVLESPFSSRNASSGSMPSRHNSFHASTPPQLFIERKGRKYLAYSYLRRSIQQFSIASMTSSAHDCGFCVGISL